MTSQGRDTRMLPAGRHLAVDSNTWPWTESSGAKGPPWAQESLGKQNSCQGASGAGPQLPTTIRDPREPKGTSPPQTAALAWPGRPNGPSGLKGIETRTSGSAPCPLLPRVTLTGPGSAGSPEAGAPPWPACGTIRSGDPYIPLYRHRSLAAPALCRAKGALRGAERSQTAAPASVLQAERPLPRGHQPRPGWNEIRHAGERGL